MEKENNLPPNRKQLVDMVVAHLESGKIPWHRGWSSEDFPRNAITGKEYRGINYLMLSMMPFEDNRWCTYNQSQEKGWQVKKGSKGTPIEVYKIIDRRTQKDVQWDKIKEETAKLSEEEKKEFYKKNIRTFLRTYTVFNGEQIEGIPPFERKALTEEQLKQQSDRAEKIIENSEAKVFFDGNGRNYYSPGNDTIHLCRKETFHTMPDYYATALHEIGHSSGHETRLNRNLTGGVFGTASYAKEELRAELGSMFLQQDLNIPMSEDHIKNHSAYIQNWIELLKDKPEELFAAVSDANKISEYVLSRENQAAAKKNIDQDLTPEQAAFFKDSVIRDAAGNLQKAYHGTAKDFETFDMSKTSPYGILGNGFYFSSSETIAKSYMGGVLQEKTVVSHVKECYLNIKKPYLLDVQITDKELTKLRNLVKNNQDDFFFKRIDENSSGKLPAEWNKAFRPEPQLIHRNHLTELKTFLAKDNTEYSTEGLTRGDVFGILTDNFNAISGKKQMHNYLKAEGFDGLIIKETKGNGLPQQSKTMKALVHDIYVAFSPEQIKYTSNKKPTLENADMRFAAVPEVAAAATKPVRSLEKIEPLQIYKQTDKAVLVKLQGEGTAKFPLWLPKDQIKINTKENIVDAAQKELISNKGLMLFSGQELKTKQK